MAEVKILTKHPLGKHGVNVSKETYELFKKAILSALRGGELTHPELIGKLDNTLRNSFSGSIGWYAETMKLDLEARGVIERTKSKPQRYRLK